MFNPEAPFDEVPLFMAHPVGALLQPFLPASPETDPSKESGSTSSSSSTLKGEEPSPGGLEAIGIMVNGFLSSKSS